MYEIIKAPNATLAKKAKPVKKIDKSILAIIERMKQSLLAAKDPIGVGLAAPQIGESLQIFMAKPSDKSQIHVFINPRLEVIGGSTTRKPRKNSKEIKLEGCLSLPNIWGEVKRNDTLSLSYMDEKGILKTKKVTGFLSTIVQHEMDHLNGVLFPKRVLEQKGKLYKSEKNEKGEDVFEEIEI